MADANDVATVIQSALDEIGMTGRLRVAKDGQRANRSLNDRSGNNVAVDVNVQDISPRE